MYVPVYVDRCIHTCVLLYIYIYIYICSYIHTYIHTYMYVHKHVHKYIHTCVYTYIHTYNHTHIHTCMHAYTGIKIQSSREMPSRLSELWHVFTCTSSCSDSLSNCYNTHLRYEYDWVIADRLSVGTKLFSLFDGLWCWYWCVWHTWGG